MTIANRESREELKALMGDPIIQAMADEIRRNGNGDVDLDDWSFIQMAHQEYGRRGGDARQTTICGPAYAIHALLATDDEEGIAPCELCALVKSARRDYEEGRL